MHFWIIFTVLIGLSLFVLNTDSKTRMEMEKEQGKAESLGDVRFEEASGLTYVTEKGEDLFFSVSDHNARIYKGKIRDDQLQILQTITLQPSMQNIDLEGVAYDANKRTFWLSDEFAPSILEVSLDGEVKARYIPEGTRKQFEGEIALIELIPQIYTTKRENRGFEGIAITPDGSFLYVMLQSPLTIEDKKHKKSARAVRVLKIDIKAKQIAGEYAYLLEDAKNIKESKQIDLMIGDIAALSSNQLLVIERDNKSGNQSIYKMDISGATNLIDTIWHQNIEKFTVGEWEAKGIRSVNKELVVDLHEVNYFYPKVEGLAIVNQSRLAIINDNDGQGATKLHIFDLNQRLFR